MIPVRMGSKRVLKKNIRLLDGKPLVSYIIEAAIASRQFDEIYLNSEDDIFKGIAKQHGIKFYKRSKKLASDEATNDDFAYDFMKKVKSDIVIQLLATSPFISGFQISKFVNTMIVQNTDTLISTKNVQIECLYYGLSVNFSQTEKTKPSQSLEPIQAYACALMGWRTSLYKKNMGRWGSAYHGGNLGTTRTFTLEGISTIDIDNEYDFRLAELVCQSLKTPTKKPQYYGEKPNELISDSNVPRILKQDGVQVNYLNGGNDLTRNIYEVIAVMPKKKSWSYRFINTESNSMTAICQMKGEGNRKHYHAEWNEWWIIWKGTWEFEIEGKKYHAMQGDCIFIPKGKVHKIKSMQDNSIRLAVSRADVPHIYVKK